jgi:uncharacterized membrane protein
MGTDHEVLQQVKARQDKLERLIQDVRELQSSSRAGSNSIQFVAAPVESGERAVHRVEKYFVAMVALNLCMGGALVLNWITDTNQTHVINAIYMMAPGRQEQIESKQEKSK